MARTVEIVMIYHVEDPGETARFFPARHTVKASTYVKALEETHGGYVHEVRIRTELTAVAFCEALAEAVHEVEYAGGEPEPDYDGPRGRDAADAMRHTMAEAQRLK